LNDCTSASTIATRPAPIAIGRDRSVIQATAAMTTTRPTVIPVRATTSSIVIRSVCGGAAGGAPKGCPVVCGCCWA
jgi:hypothetical protein